MGLIKIGELSANPGQKIRGKLIVQGDHDPRYDPPLVIVNGIQPGKTVVLLGGTHGTEYASIEAVTRLSKILDPKKMSGAVIIVLVLNVAQFEERTQFVSPVDNLNLNSVFPGKPDGSLTERLAHTLFNEAVSQCDALVDCHGGDINEDLRGFVVASDSGDEELNQESLYMAACYNTALVHVFPSKVPGMTNSAQKIYGIPCIMPEAGTPFPVREEAIKFHVDGFRNVLKYLGILAGEPNIHGQLVSPKRLKLYSEENGSWECQVGLDQEVKEGDKLGVVKDLFGDVVQELVTPIDGIVSMRRCFYSVKENELLVVLSSLK